MPQCPTCGKQLDPAARFCPEDGTPLSDTAASTLMKTPTGHATQTRELSLPLLLGNRYRLEAVLGGGGMAKVYRANDATLEREVAVKLINPELRAEPEFDARFQREARIASQLTDPHIVVVHDFGLDAEHGPYLVMEYLQGESLREHIKNKGPLPVRAGMQLCIQLLLALIHAHDKNIIHRDIKPDNVFLLNQSGVRMHVRVLDFGIARIYRSDEASNAETLTRPGAVLGTPRYMSPEQLGGRPVDVRSDLYSAALVTFEALTGTLPYVSHKGLAELCPDLPVAFREVLEQCLRPIPDERPTSALDVYLRLQEPCKASGILILPPGMLEKLAASKAETPTVAYRVSKPSRRRRRALIAGAVGLLCLIGLGFWMSGSWKPLQASEEELLGLRVGMDRDDVIEKLGKAQEQHAGTPFSGKSAADLGTLLTEIDLAGSQDLSKMVLLGWPKEQVWVLLADSKVAAVLVRTPHKATSARGVRLGDTERQLKQHYAERPMLETRDVPAGAGEKGQRWVEEYRYPQLGISFEIQGERIQGMAIYPRRDAAPSDAGTGRRD